MRPAYAGAILAIGALCALPASAADVTKLRSAGALAFGAENVLFVGDTKAGGVHAYEFQAAAFDSQKDVFGGRAETFEGWVLVDKIDRKIAGLLGIDPVDVQINDMVVHRPSQQVYLPVHRGYGPDAEPVIVKVNKGKVEIVDLSSAKHSFTDVGPVPTGEKLEFGGAQRDLAITDIDYYGGEIFVAGVSTGSFASKLRRTAYPFDGKLKSSSIEIWLRDEGEAYGRKLAAAGVPVRSVRYNGTIHDFMLLNPIAKTPAVRGAVDQASDYLRKVFADR